MNKNVQSVKEDIFENMTLLYSNQDILIQITQASENGIAFKV